MPNITLVPTKNYVVALINYRATLKAERALWQKRIEKCRKGSITKDKIVSIETAARQINRLDAQIDQINQKIIDTRHDQLTVPSFKQR